MKVYALNAVCYYYKKYYDQATVNIVPQCMKKVKNKGKNGSIVLDLKRRVRWGEACRNEMQHSL